MCGIIFRLRRNQSPDLSQLQPLDHLIRARGPDSFCTIHRTIPTASPDTYLIFSASVLALRGHSPVVQPLTDETSGCVLIWNGEAWKFRGETITDNDTRPVFAAILTALGSRLDAEDRALAVKNVLRDITGPFAVLFYDAISQRIIYGRDPIGRRSLLRARMQDGEVCISSVSDPGLLPIWEEVKTAGIYTLDLLQTDSDGQFKEKLIPWSSSSENFFPRLNRSTNLPSNQSFPSPDVVDQFHTVLLRSLRLRTTNTAPGFGLTNNHDQYAVLFSGGVDCSLLAFMLDQVLPGKCTIDLLNVAFENPRVIAAARQHANRNEEHERKDIESAYEACPDRKTGLSSYAELCKICPDRSWRFVRIDVPYEETLAQKALVTSLMYPHNTEMDLSISLALFFASRGRGTIQHSETNIQYATSAKILFSGLGADEIFGGYTRHAKAFAYSGLEGLLEELNLDYNRLADRNLGRDDRIISHWGRETRYPYLDEELIGWALNLPVWEKCGYANTSQSSPRSLESSKLLLRTLASQVGLSMVSKEKKRAIQFGSRTAKMNVGKSKGTDAIGS